MDDYFSTILPSAIDSLSRSRGRILKVEKNPVSFADCPTDDESRQKARKLALVQDSLLEATRG